MNRRDFIKRGALLVPAVVLPRLIQAQTILQAPDLASFHRKVSGGGGGGGSQYSLIFTSTGSGDGSATTTTTTAANAVGSSIIVVGVSSGRFHVSQVVTDDAGNTYTLYNQQNISGIPTAIYYCNNPTGLTSTFKIKFTASGDNAVGQNGMVFVAGFSGSSATAPTDGHAESNCTLCSGSGVQAGSITPTVSTGIMFSIVSASATVGTWSIDSSFTIIGQGFAHSTTPDVAAAWYLETDASAKNPKWTKTSTVENSSACNAAFK